MGQVFPNSENIGKLSYSSGVITLQPSRVTIGGQQYNTGTLNMSLGSLSPAVRYQLYLVTVGGVIQLVKSTNENSVGPSGYSWWKLVGCFMSDGSSGFGAFMNINDTPSFSRVTYTPGVSGQTAVSSPTAWVSRDGARCMIQGMWTFSGTSNTTQPVISIFPGTTIRDPQTGASAFRGRVLGDLTYTDVGNSRLVHARIYSYDSNPISLLQGVSFYSGNAATNGSLGNYIVYQYTPVAGCAASFNAEFLVNEWSDTPIKDL